MKRHATKMGRRTAFHAEAERVRLLNLHAATASEIYYADAMLKELKRMARNTRSERRRRFEAAFERRSNQIKNQLNQMFGFAPHDDVAMIEFWKKLLIRDDIRAYGADRTKATTPAEIGQWMWWTNLSEHERFDVVELSKPVLSERKRIKIIFGL